MERFKQLDEERIRFRAKKFDEALKSSPLFQEVWMLIPVTEVKLSLVQKIKNLFRKEEKRTEKISLHDALNQVQAKLTIVNSQLENLKKRVS